MGNTDPLPDHEPEAHDPRVVNIPPLELHSPRVPPIEYVDKRDARVIALITFAHTLWGKVAIGALATAIVGGTILHFAHHRKPAAHPVTHVQAIRVTPKHAAAKSKPASSKNSSHKSDKKSTKTAKKKATKKKSAHSDKSTPKSQSKPWFSSRESNG